MNTCSDCAIMRPSDGYCRRKGNYVPALSQAPAKCFLARYDEDVTTELVVEPAPAPPRNAAVKDKPKRRIRRTYDQIAKATEKRCSCCGRILPMDHFNLKKASPDGFDYTCRECIAKRQRVYREKKKAKIAETIERQQKTAKAVTKETMTDAEMVYLLRQHGWTVTCTKTESL